MRITSKGQVTIPQAIREKAGLLPHTEVEFKYENGKVVLARARTVKGMTRGQSMAGRISGRGDVNATTDEIMAMTRGQRLASKLVGRGDVRLTTDEIMAMTRGYAPAKSAAKSKKRA